MKIKLMSLISIFIFTVYVFININTTYTYAAEDEKKSGISEIFTGAKNFLDKGDDTTFDDTTFKQTSGMIFNILLSIGFVAAIIISAILGIKFMIGSVEEKAQVKDALIPFIIGCIVIFGAFGIWKIFVTIGRSL